jgi:succinoglycan biosynthesis protein ExoA
MKPPEDPFVSVILPIRNEGKFIQKTLDAVLHQNYPRDRYEILVSDGQSTDQTREIIGCLQRASSHLKLIDNPGKIVSTGLNAALFAAKGEVIIRVDGHTIIDPDYIRGCVKALQTSGAENVGGKMTGNGIGPFGEAVAAVTSSPFGVGGSRFHFSNSEEWVDSVYMGAWPRNVFEKIGIFDEELVRDQDDEFNYRLRQYGGRILLCPQIRSTYFVRSTPASLWKQYFQYGYWKVRVLQKRPRQMSLRHFIPPIFVAVILGSLFLSLFSHLGWILLGLVTGSYLIANISASLLTATSQKGITFFNLLIPFALLHCSYGLGFLIGLVKFAHRWGDKVDRVPLTREPYAG